MATIKKIVPSGGISDFRQGTPAAGTGFRMLAAGMDAAYERLKPAAIKEQTELGDELGRQIARQQIGDPAGSTIVASSMGGGPAVPVSGQWVVDGLVARGMPLHIAEGFALNFHDESGFNPGINEAAPIVPGSRGGYGLAQWTGERRRALEAFADGRGVAVHDPNVQLDFLMEELGGAEADAWGKISQTGDRGSAAAAIVNYFERPSEEHRSRRAAKYLGGGGTITKSSSGGELPPSVAPTMLREADGALTARLYSPLSGEILQAHNAAAGVAYQSEVMFKGAADFMALSEQYALNPDGFRQAAQEYVSGIVENAPPMFRSEVRGNLEKEMQRRFLGMMDERQRDIRQRANNSSAALADMWGDQFAQAIAGGNPEEIAAARDQLDGVLRARESLPGVAWTPEQSANAMRKAEEAGANLIEKKQREQASIWSKALGLISDTAQAGRHAADESILDNPLIQQLLPEEWGEAAAFVALRDNLPSFNLMTPAEQAQALIAMKDQPVQESWEIGLYDAAEKVASYNADAWKKDPIKRAGEVFPDQPPPPLPVFDPTDPSAFVEALTARQAYAQQLFDNGYTDRVVYVSKDEAVAMGALLGAEVPPEVKAITAGAIVSGMGKDAARFFDQISTTDKTIQHAGALMATTGNSTVATEVMTGKALLDQKVVSAPESRAVAAALTPDMRQALGIDSGAVDLSRGNIPQLDQVREAAVAIYAARIPANADKATQQKVMTEAWQAAMGQRKELDLLYGGVQKVGSSPVLLPPEMTGQELESAINRAFGSTGSSMPIMPVTIAQQVLGLVPDIEAPAALNLWEQAGGIPSLGGVPLDATAWERGEIVLTPMGGTSYMMSVKRNGELIDVRSQGSRGNVPFIFDAAKLVEAARMP